MTKNNKWHMTDAEIRLSWRRCVNKEEQVKIIAELNARTKKETEQKLRELGIEVPVKPKKRKEEALNRKIWNLRTKGMTFENIAKELGGERCVKTVTWRYKQMVREREEALPVLIKALRAYQETEACKEEDRETITTWIERGI